MATRANKSLDAGNLKLAECQCRDAANAHAAYVKHLPETVKDEIHLANALAFLTVLASDDWGTHRLILA